jgi:hypothetical protein
VHVEAGRGTVTPLCVLRDVVLWVIFMNVCVIITVAMVRLLFAVKVL